MMGIAKGYPEKSIRVLSPDEILVQHHPYYGWSEDTAVAALKLAKEQINVLPVQSSRTFPGTRRVYTWSEKPPKKGRVFQFMGLPLR